MTEVIHLDRHRRKSRGLSDHHPQWISPTPEGYEPDTDDAFDGALEFVRLAKLRHEASPLHDPIDDRNAAEHYRLALQLLGTIAMNQYPQMTPDTYTDDPFRHAVDDLRDALRAGDTKAANAARLEIYAHGRDRTNPIETRS